MIKVRPRLDIIQRAGEVFVILDLQVSFATRPFFKAGWNKAFKCSLVYREHQRSTALDDEVQKIHFRIAAGTGKKHATMRKEHDCLIGRGRLCGQEQVSRNPFLSIRSVKVDGLLAPTFTRIFRLFDLGVERHSIVVVDTFVHRKNGIWDWLLLLIIAYSRIWNRLRESLRK